MQKILIITFTLLFSTFTYAVDCKMEFKNHLQTDLELSYKEFDQTMNSGMRVLANAGCHQEAADLIEAYIEKNNATKNSLRWHIAQQRAMAGDYPRSILSAKQVILETEDYSVQPLRWNDYVLATIAFMEGDKNTLITHRNEVEKGKDDYFGNELNLKLLDGLIKNFGKSYEFATSNL